MKSWTLLYQTTTDKVHETSLVNLSEILFDMTLRSVKTMIPGKQLASTISTLILLYYLLGFTKAWEKYYFYI